MSKEMLINIAEGEECRIAVLSDDGVLQELYMERTSSASQVGNIYKGRITNVEASIQAAFIDYGAVKNGFLHISDLLPQYFPSGQRGSEAVGKKRARRDRPPIQECLRRGQEIVVQVIKEGIGTKGPTLTTYLSIPGRFLVMMPGMTRLGVSRKIEDEALRQKMKTVLEELKPPSGLGFIIRTAAMDRAKRDLQGDLNYLLRLWRSVEKRLKTARAPAELYQESDLVTRTIRDIYSSEIKQIICDNHPVAEKVGEFLNVVMPRGKHNIKIYTGPKPLFHHYGLEQEIEKIYARRVELTGGGSLVVDQTEALVAIDVNSGRFRESSDAEQTAFRMNVRAASEIARQLRLRDMGGVIVIDFIDMREDKHRREVERVLRDGVKDDRARTKILKISRFGIIEMTRQRVRPSLKLNIYRQCSYCTGSGLIKSDESMALDVMRNLQLACANDQIVAIELTVAPGVAEYLSNQRRKQLAGLEEHNQVAITVRGDASSSGDNVVFHCVDARGSVVPWDAAAAAGKPTGKPSQQPKPTPIGDDELVDIADYEAPVEPEDELTPTADQPEPAKGDKELLLDRVEEPEGKPAVEGEKHKRRRRRGRRRKSHQGQAQPAQPAANSQQAKEADEGSADTADKPQPPENTEPPAPQPAEKASAAAASEASKSQPAPADAVAAEKPKKPARRRRRSSSRKKAKAVTKPEAATDAPVDAEG